MTRFAITLFGFLSSAVFAGPISVSFGFFDGKDSREAAFSNAFKTQSTIDGYIGIDGKQFSLPPGSWKILANGFSNSKIKNINNGSSISNISHGYITLGQGDNGQLKKLMRIEMPISGIMNRTWITKVPFCSEEYQSIRTVEKKIHSVKEDAYDCESVVVYALGEWFGIDDDEIKENLYKIGWKYSMSDVYVSREILVTKNAGYFTKVYSEHVKNPAVKNKYENPEVASALKTLGYSDEIIKSITKPGATVYKSNPEVIDFINRTDAMNDQFASEAWQ